MGKYSIEKQPTFPLSADPAKQSAVLERHGQWVRVLQTRVCPCLSNGKEELFCPVCEGLGFLYSFQRSFRIVEEPHTLHEKVNRIMTDLNPIMNVEKVTRILHKIQGGNAEYRIDKFDEKYIEISGNNLPQKYEKILVTYEYDRWNNVYNEHPIIENYFTLRVQDCRIDTTLTQNPQEIYGDITKVQRVYNRTKDWTYTVDSFFRQTILLNKTVPNMPKIEAGDIIEVDYSYCPAILITTQALQATSNVQQKWFNIMIGDVEASFPYQIQLKKGDLITFLFAERPADEIYSKNGVDIDVLNAFDVSKIIGDIIDVNGKVYKDQIDFILSDYNKIKWIGKKPDVGTKFSVVYTSRPTYVVFDKEPEAITSENKQFPKRVQLRLYQKTKKKEMFLFQEEQ